MARLAVCVHLDVAQLRPALKAAKITQRDLARQLEVSHVDVNKVLAATDSGGLLEQIATIVTAAALAAQPQE